MFKNISNSENMKIEENQLSTEQYEVLVECLEIGFKILLKNKALGINTEFLIGFC